MDRQLPPGLSDAQRCVLLEFYAGHITAGQLTERLCIDASARPQVNSAPEHGSRRALSENRSLLRPFEFLRASIRRSHGHAVGGTRA
jgi:hypothetical protein